MSRYRTAFAKDVEHFIKEYSTIAPRMAAFQTDSKVDTKFANVLRELSNAHPEISAAMRAPRNIMIDARDRVTDAIKEAATNGLISESDFGFFGNSEIKSLISAAPSSQSLCK